MIGLALSKLSDSELMKSNGFKEILAKKTKLTDWKVEPTIDDLKYDLSQAKISHASFVANLSKWDSLYEAPKFGNSKSKGSRVVPKLVRKQAEWRCPSLSEPFLSTNALFEVRALTHEDVPRAKQNMLVLNNQFNTQLDKVNLVDKIIRCLVKNGTTIVRLGWDYQEIKVIEKIPEYEYKPVPIEAQEQIQEQYSQLSQLMNKEPDSYEQLPEELKAGLEMSIQQGTLFVANPIGFIKQEVVKPIVNKPTVEVCNLKNIYIDPTCEGDLNKAQFIIHSYESSLAELSKANYYQNLDYLKQYEQYNTLEHASTSTGFSFQDRARKKLVVYEYWGYWDIEGKGKTTAIVASWVGDVLIRLEENPFPDKKLPFVIFNYIPEDSSIYGIPDAELLEDNQAILGAVTRGVIDLLGKSANSQTGFSKNFLDATNKIKFRNGEDYEFNPNFDPRVHVHTHKYPEIPNSAMTVIQMMNNDAEAISGVKAFSGTGINASHLGDVAVGIRGVLDAVSKREMSILRRISHGFIQMGRKIIAMNAEFLSDKEVVRITNSEFVTVRRDDLAGNFDLTLSISTAEADDAKAKELAFMLQTIGNTLGSGISQMMLSEIASLRKMPDLAKAILEYQPEPDPLQQQLQELQLQKLQAEIALLRAEAQEATAKSYVQQAKVDTEQAKAENLQSDASNKALDFIQRDTGIKHTQELEKQDLINQGVYNQQLAKNEGLSQQVVDKHNSQLLQNYANSALNIQ